MRNLLFLAVFAALWLTACSGSASDDVNGNANAAAPQIPAEQYTDAAAALKDGTDHLERGDTSHAIELLNRAVELDPDLADAYFQLGIAHSMIEFRDHINAIEAVNEPPGEGNENTGPSDTDKPASTLAFEKAVEAYKKRVEANKEDHAAYYNLGRSYNKLNQDPQAANALRQAVKLKPDDVEYQAELGSILIKLAKYGEAVGALKKAADIDPENVEVQELLEKAEAGLKRINFTTLPKDPNANKETSNSAEEGTGASPNAPPTNTRPTGPPPPPRATPPQRNKP